MAIGYVLLALATIESLLGIWFIVRYQKSASTIFYGLFCIGVAVYVGANGLGQIKDIFDIGERFSWAGGAMATALFLPFSFSFPVPRRTSRELLPLVLWPLIIFPLAMIFTDLFIRTEGIVSYREGYQTAAGSFFWFFLTFFAVYWLWAIGNLVTSHRSSDGIHRWQLKMILIGIGASLSVSVAFDIILPLLIRSPFGYVGSLMTSVWLFVTAYIVLKK